MKIKHILTAHHSRRDIYGNCYWFFTYTSTENGKTVRGKVSGSESNIRSIILELNGGEWSENAHFNVEEMPIREFNRAAKNLKYAGCTPDQLVEFIRGEMKKES